MTAVVVDDATGSPRAVEASMAIGMPITAETVGQIRTLASAQDQVVDRLGGEPLLLLGDELHEARLKKVIPR